MTDLARVRQLYESRFDRAIEMAREYGYHAFAEILDGLKAGTFTEGKREVIEIKPLSLKEQILEVGRALGNFTSKNVEYKTTYGYGSVSKALQELVASGEIIRHGNGNRVYYTLPVNLRQVG
jgi:hypothetical protein